MVRNLQAWAVFLCSAALRLSGTKLSFIRNQLASVVGIHRNTLLKFLKCLLKDSFW